MIADVENSHGYFQPANTTPAVLRQELFPERYPQIPLAVAGATTRVRERRGQKQAQRSKAASVSGTTREEGNARKTHQSVLAVLWGAIREVSWLIGVVWEHDVLRLTAVGGVGLGWRAITWP